MTTKSPRDTAIDEVSAIVRELCEEHKVQLAGDPRISSNASYEECLAYAGYHYTTYDDHNALRDGCRSGSVNSRLRQMWKALEAGASELDKSLLIDIGCGPGLFLHAACAQANSEETVLYGYDHSREMLQLAKDVWNRRELTPEPRFCQKYKKITEAAKNDLQSHPKHLIFTFGFVWVQVARDKDKQVLADFSQHAASCISTLAQHARTCTIVAVDSGSWKGNKAAFTEALDRILKESQLEWDKKPFYERGNKLSAIRTVRKSNE